MGLVANVVVAHLLGVRGFGEFALIQSTIATVGVFAGYGLGLTTTKYIAEFADSAPIDAGKVLSLMTVSSVITSAVGGVLILANASMIRMFLHLDLAGDAELKLSAILLMANTLWVVQQSALVGFQSFRQLAANNISYGTVVLVSTIPLTIAYGLAGTLIALIAGALLGSVLAYRSVLVSCRDKSIPLTMGWERRHFRLLYGFSFPALLSGIFVMPVSWLAFAKISGASNGIAEIGIFNAANQWRTLVLFVPQSLNAFALPLFSEAHGARDHGRFRSTMLFTVTTSLTFALGAAILLVLFRGPIMALFGGQFEGGTVVVVILLATAVVQTLATAVGQSLAGSGRMWAGAFLNLAWAITVLFAVGALFDATAAGLAESFLLGYAVLFLLTLLHIWPQMRHDRKLNQTGDTD
jgi:O-antigen/teichoic acid export membrane protein